MFLSKLYREWRLMFWCVLLFAAGQCFFMYKGIENVPFFLYHMYAKPHPSADSVTIFAIVQDGKRVNPTRLSNREQELLFNSLGAYLAVRNNSNTDPIDADIANRLAGRVGAGVYQTLFSRLSNSGAALDAYPAWWGRYFRAVFPGQQGAIAVVQTRVSLRPPFALSGQDSLLFNVFVP